MQPKPNKGQIKKGEVRNPTGENAHKKERREVKALFQEFLNELHAVQVNGDLINKTRLRWIMEKAYAMAMAGSYPHFKELLDQAFDKPTQRSEISGPNGAQLQLMSAEQAFNALREANLEIRPIKK